MQDEGGSGSFAGLGEVLEFMRLFWAIDHSIQRISKRMEMDSGITLPQRLVLGVIARLPGTAAGVLAKILHVHPSTLTGIIRRMEDRGYLRRHLDPKDARKVRLSLSAKGKELSSQLSSVEESFYKVLANLNGEEIGVLRRALKMLVTELGKHGF